MFLCNDRVNLCRLSWCRKGEQLPTITPDGTLNSCLTFKVLFIQVPYNQAITSHVLRWVQEGGGANQNAKRCPDFCPVAQLCCFWHTTWFCLYVLILQKLCYVYCKNHFSGSWNISNENIYDMTKCDVNACICTCMCTICASCMCVHAYISMLWIFYR